MNAHVMIGGLLEGFSSYNGRKNINFDQKWITFKNIIKIIKHNMYDNIQQTFQYVGDVNYIIICYYYIFIKL